MAEEELPIQLMSFPVKVKRARPAICYLFLMIYVFIYFRYDFACQSFIDTRLDYCAYYTLVKRNIYKEFDVTLSLKSFSVPDD